MRSILAIDLSIFSLQERGGISVVWGEYLKRLPGSIDDFMNIEVLIPQANNMVLRELDLRKFRQKAVRARGRYSKYLPSLLRGSRSDVLHMSYYGWYPFFRGRKIVTVHDFTHELYATGIQRFLHNLLKRVAIWGADVILCISEATKADLIRFYPTAVANKQVRVIPNAASGNFYPEPTLSEVKGDPYLLWVAGRSGYKNFESALQSMMILRQKGENIGLIVVGSPFAQEEKQRIGELRLDDVVEVLTDVDDKQLRQLYSDALALLYLSRYEGFGLPILEAQRCRCPVICLPVPACKEVGADSVMYLDESDPGSIASLYHRLQCPQDREEIIAAGEDNARRFSWDDSVDALVNVYKEIATI